MGGGEHITVYPNNHLGYRSPVRIEFMVKQLIELFLLFYILLGIVLDETFIVYLLYVLTQHNLAGIIF